jgi:hypothetical protein
MEEEEEEVAEEYNNEIRENEIQDVKQGPFYPDAARETEPAHTPSYVPQDLHPTMHQSVPTGHSSSSIATPGMFGSYNGL